MTRSQASFFLVFIFFPLHFFLQITRLGRLAAIIESEGLLSWVNVAVAPSILLNLRYGNPEVQSIHFVFYLRLQFVCVVCRCVSKLELNTHFLKFLFKSFLCCGCVNRHCMDATAVTYHGLC